MSDIGEGRRWPLDVEPEVADWLDGLPDAELGQVAFHVNRLRELGPALGEPHSRQLRGRLRELRFHVERRQHRITYCFTAERRIVLLTVFRKTRRRETLEVERAMRAMSRHMEGRR